MKIKAIDLFCGAGGVTRGLLDADIDVIAGFDIDNDLKQVYEHNNIRKNNQSVKYINQDVQSITKKDIFDIVGNITARKVRKEKFLLAGCAPCQPFSSMNMRKNLNDPRRTLLKSFADLIKETKPDFVFMENVAGIERLDCDSLQYFKDTLNNLKYKFDAKVIDVANYGIPQFRKRYVLVASKTKNITLPQNTINDDNYITVADTIKNLPKIKAGEKSKNLDSHCSRNLSELNLKRIKATPHNGGSRKDWEDKSLIPDCHKNTNGFSNIYARLWWDRPSPTLTTRFNAYSSGRFGHPEQNRALSLLEGALLQSFSLDYKFFGSSEKISRQIGNAVPPKLAKTIGLNFFAN